MRPDLMELGKRVREGRRAAQLGRRELAASAGVSVSYLAYIEGGKRIPRPYLLNKLADALALSWTDRNELAVLAGQEGSTAGDSPDPWQELQRILRDAADSPRELQELLEDLKHHIARWKRISDGRKRRVQKAVVPAAGWQPRLLSAAQIGKAVMHALHEAREAGLVEVVIVAAPDPPFPRIASPVDLKITTKVQREPVGLGHAILETQDLVGNEPVAVILPDDFDPSRSATRSLTRWYVQQQRPIVAVNPGPFVVSAELQHWGVATVVASSVDSILYEVTSIQEKPLGAVDSNARIVAGRYVLTPEVFDVLKQTPRNRTTGKLELSDALNSLITNRVERVYACELPKALLPMTPVRRLLEELIEALDDSRRFEQILELTQGVLKATTHRPEALRTKPKPPKAPRRPRAAH